MTTWYEVGEDYMEEGANLTSYPIDECRSGARATHYEKIVVYGDEELRDRIVELLNDNG